MSRYSARYSTVLIFLSLSLTSGNLMALQPPDAGLQQGMNYGDVLRLKGPAQEKEEHEIKRLDVWRYPGIALNFREGRLDSWSTPHRSAQSYPHEISDKAIAEHVDLENKTEAYLKKTIETCKDDGACTAAKEALARRSAPQDRKVHEQRVGGLLDEIMRELPADSGPSSGAVPPYGGMVPQQPVPFNPPMDLSKIPR